MSVVLDSSAVLALLWTEIGADIVAAALADSEISAVNHAEVLTKLEDRKLASPATHALLKQLGITVVAFDEAHAELAAKLRNTTRSFGLSLGDRACIALAKLRNKPVLTADSAWAQIELGVTVKLVR